MLRKFLLPMAIVAMSVTAVSAADNQLGILGGAKAGDTFYDLGLARADMVGSIQIETFSGVVVGMMELNEGTNTDVRVPFMRPLLNTDLVAKLIIGGEVVDMGIVRVSDE